MQFSKTFPACSFFDPNSQIIFVIFEIFRMTVRFKVFKSLRFDIKDHRKQKHGAVADQVFSVYICIFMYIHIYFTCIYYVHIHIHTCLHVMYIYIHTHIFIHIYIMYICTYIHTYICVCVGVCLLMCVYQNTSYAIIWRLFSKFKSRNCFILLYK